MLWQLSRSQVFVENKPGRLADISTLAFWPRRKYTWCFFNCRYNGFGILRLIVSETHKAAKVLKEHGVAVSITEVVGNSIPDVTGAFAKVVSFF